MRSKYDEQLELLNREMIAMGALCEEVISLASRALMEHSTVIASKVKPLDADIDQKEREIESLCLKLLLRLPIRYPIPKYTRYDRIKKEILQAST